MLATLPPRPHPSGSICTRYKEGLLSEELVGTEHIWPCSRAEYPAALSALATLGGPAV